MAMTNYSYSDTNNDNNIDNDDDKSNDNNNNYYYNTNKNNDDDDDYCDYDEYDYSDGIGIDNYDDVNAIIKVLPMNIL